MHKTKRLSLVLTSMEKTGVEPMAEAEGELSQSILVRRLFRHAACQHGIWPPDKRRHKGLLIQEVQCG